MTRENRNTLWQDAIEKEMLNVKVAFKITDRGEILVGYQEIECHVVFDVKMEANFRRKARLVAGGHMTEAPVVSTYASAVSRDTVCITLTYTALNDLEVKGANIQNTYISAPCKEKIFTKLRLEFGPNAGKYAIITRALYGLKSAGASFN